MYIEKNEANVITIEKEIKVFGLSHKNTGIAAFDMWSKIHEITRDVNHKKTPEINYGIWTPPHPGGDYIVGTEVTDFEGQNYTYSTFTVPAGRYLQITFNVPNIDELLNDRIWSCCVTGIDKRAEECGVTVNKEGITVEIYPNGLFEMQYPEMFYLWCIKE